MAENDEVHEDLQVVAMTAGAAAARTAETLIRARTSQQADRDTRQRQSGQNSSPAQCRDPELVKARQVADAQDRAGSRSRASLTDPDTWTVTGGDPVTKAQQWTLNHGGVRAENMPATKADASKMITALHSGQSSRDIRAARHAADAMNGKPAAAAARWESINKDAQRQPAPRIQQRGTGRSR